jgi:serine/threonine protein kinase
MTTKNFNLEKYSRTDLQKMAERMDLPLKKNKLDLIKDISSAFKEYEEYKKEKIDRYKIGEQLGEKGKEGTTYLVTDMKNNKKYAMKTFRKAKSSSVLEREYEFQKKAHKCGISPKVYDYDTVSKYIVMEKMDSHLYDYILSKKGILKKEHQERIVEIFKKLDKIKVFHGDANILNYMIRKGGEDSDKLEIKIIDFGFSKEINDRLIKKLGTENPNYDLMTIGFVLKLREMKVSEKSYKYLLKHISKENKEKYGL